MIDNNGKNRIVRSPTHSAMKEHFGYQSLGKMASIANEAELQLTNNDHLKNIGKAININIKNFKLPSKIGNILPNIYSNSKRKPKNSSQFHGYPSPSECYQMFKDAGLKPPKFLENPENAQHIPPHIIALELLHMCCNNETNKPL